MPQVADDSESVRRLRRNARLGQLLVKRAASGYVMFGVTERATGADVGREAGAPTWIASCEFGREAEDSPMVAGANYGTGNTSAEAIDALLDEARIP